MTVKDLIEELMQYDENLPICIDDYMGFVEADEKTIDVKKVKYICFPFMECDEFDYISLRSSESDI